MLRQLILNCCYIVFFAQAMNAQDIHFSQYFNSPLNFNPALSGLFTEDIRFIANSKHQWAAVPVNYLTFSGSYDRKRSLKRLRNGLFVPGAIFNYDQAGDSRMSMLQLAGNFAYIKRVGELNLISIGTQIGFRDRYFNDGNLTFDRQYVGEVFDPKAGTGENFSNRNVFVIDFGVGINYRMQLRDKRSHLDFGVGIFHPHEPRANFNNNDRIGLHSRKTIYIMTTFKLSKKIDVISNVAGQNQGPYNAFYASNLYKFYLKKDKNTERAIQVGASYRFGERGDAVIPKIEFLTERYRLGLSYDMTISPFKEVNNLRGGPEVAFQYLITTVKAVKSSKACPIF